MELLIDMIEFNNLKSRDMVNLKCKHCSGEFLLQKNHVQRAIKKTKGTAEFCSQKCHQQSKSIMKEIKCEQCEVVILRRLCDINRIKKGSPAKYNFCSISCSTTYHNQHKTFGIKRSKAEIYLCNQIKNTFPTLVINECDRDVLPSKLELDIYMPTIKLAIELNGPVHYLPIFGEDRLNKQQSRDSIKIKEAIEFKIRLLIIDISFCKYWKTTEPYLNKIFIEEIFPIIEDLISF